MSSQNFRPTERQKEYLEFISTYAEKRGVPPSFEDIGRHFLTSPPSVNGMIKTLEKRGYITRVPGQARTLRVVIPLDAGEMPEKGNKQKSIPIPSQTIIYLAWL